MSGTFPPPRGSLDPTESLLEAARNDDPALASRALTEGADPSARDTQGRTARDLAVEHGHRAVVRLIDQAAE